MKTRSEFKKILLTDKYIIWLNDFMKNKKEINDTTFIKNNRMHLSAFDKNMILYLGYFYSEILNCFYNIKPESDSIYYFIKYQKIYFRLNFDGVGICCAKYSEKEYLALKKQETDAINIINTMTNNITDNITLFPYIEYNDLIQGYDITEREIANKIPITPIDNIFKNIYGDEELFYKKITENLNKEELIFLLKNLKNKSCSTCCNKACSLTKEEKLTNGINDDFEENKCLAWYNEKIIGKSKILKLTDVNQLKEKVK